MKNQGEAKNRKDDLEKYSHAARWSRRWYQFMPRDMRIAGKNPKPSEQTCDFYEIFYGNTDGMYEGKQIFDAKNVVWSRQMDTKQWYKIVEEVENTSKPSQENPSQAPSPSIILSPSEQTDPFQKNQEKSKKSRNKFLGIGNGLRLLRHKKTNSPEKPKKETPIIKPEDYKLDLEFADDVFPDNLGDYVLDKLKRGEQINGNFQTIAAANKKDRDRLLNEKLTEIKKIEAEAAEARKKDLAERESNRPARQRYVREYEKGVIDDEDLKPRYGPGTGNILGMSKKLPEDDKPSRLIVRFMQEHPEFSQNNHSINLFNEKFENWKKTELKKYNYRNDLI